MTINAEEFAKLTEGERHLVQWQGRWSGGFVAALFEAIAKADDGNRGRLWFAFPEHVKAFNSYSKEPDWWPNLQERITQ